jgi:hypothetical protein
MDKNEINELKLISNTRKEGVAKQIWWQFKGGDKEWTTNLLRPIVVEPQLWCKT